VKHQCRASHSHSLRHCQCCC